jgi:hypothetical protein
MRLALAAAAFVCLHRAKPVVSIPDTGAADMSKGLDKKREEKKKPAKTLEEKRAAKKAKKETKRFGA